MFLFAVLGGVVTLCVFWIFWWELVVFLFDLEFWF